MILFIQKLNLTSVRSNLELLLEPIIRNLRYNASIRRNSRLSSRKLESYLRSINHKNDSQLVLGDTNSIRVSNITRLGGGLANNIYSFLVTYNERGERKQLQLAIKTYGENVYPVFESYIHDRELRMSVREWEALKNLERIGFDAPKASMREDDSRFLGYPFIIMAKFERSKKNNRLHLDHFASNLAHLHNLEIKRFDFKSLKPPKDGYSFARRWPLHFKHALNIETKHSKNLKRDFRLAIRWLEANVSDNYCPNYSLIHGDAHPANAFFTNDSKFTFIDWTSVDFGDPAFDVGNAYNLVKFFANPKDPESSEQDAKRFLSEYLEKSKVDIRSRLKFYQLVGMLGYAIPYSSGFSSPIQAIKYYRCNVLPLFPFLKLPLILLAFPFLRWPFVARQIQAEGALNWLNYFQQFMEKLD